MLDKEFQLLYQKFSWSPDLAKMIEDFIADLMLKTNILFHTKFYFQKDLFAEKLNL